jgi:ComF family protein
VAFLDLLLPQRCVACAAPGSVLCSACSERLPRIRPPLCARCGAPTAWPVARCGECAGRRVAFARARGAVAYDDAVRRLVSAWKERGLRRLARLAAEVVVEALERPDAAAIVAVPADPDRVLRRGYHPAGRLAAELGRRWELPLLPVLARTRAGPRQRGLALADRRRNVRGAFTPATRSPARVCLVDDVYTTGATASAAASGLRKAGARSIEVVTFARAIRDP